VEFTSKEKDFIQLVAKQRKVSAPIPAYGIVETVKFSWCGGTEKKESHKICKKQFHSELTNKLYKCACKCHKE